MNAHDESGPRPTVEERLAAVEERLVRIDGLMAEIRQLVADRKPAS